MRHFLNTTFAKISASVLGMTFNPPTDLATPGTDVSEQLRKANPLPLLLFTVALASCSLPQFDGNRGIGTLAQDFEYLSYFSHQSEEEAQFVEQLLGQMTLRQKVGQMVQAEIDAVTPTQARAHGLGSILNGGGSFPYQNKYADRGEWIKLANDYYGPYSTDEHTPSVPILWGTDAVHGHNNRYGAPLFPHNIGLGAANNAELTEQVFAATAADVRSTGIKWVFAPTVAVAQNLRWGRAYESFSEDPELVSALAKAAVIGLQGKGAEQLALDEKVIGTAKHFIGDGGTQNGVDQGNTVLTEQELLRVHGQSFQQAIDAGVETVMASFNSWNGDKVHGHRYLLTDVLKGQMNFQGFVIGDWNGHSQVDDCSKDSCAAAINAGVDMLMAPHNWKPLIDNTIKDVKNGRISQARIDDANRRILSVKYRAGMFDPAYHQQTAGDPARLQRLDREHRAIARQAVRESLVLLKNNNATLPLPGDSKVLLVGHAANSIAQQSGGWSLTWQGDDNGNQDFPGGQTILQALDTQLDQSGGSVTHINQAALEEILAHADANYRSEFFKGFDSALFVYGEMPYAEGAGDLTELRPPNKVYVDAKLMRAVREQGLSITSILLSGRPLSMNAFINGSDAFVAAWLPGTEASGIGDVLLADANGRPRFDFKGKLPFAWPAHAKQEDFSHAIARRSEPQFPFGYGLTYKSNTTLAQLEDHDSTHARKFVVDGKLPIFEKSVSEPWELYVGDEDNWSVNVSGNRGATQNQKTLTVSATDNMTQEDARQLRWSALKYAQFYFQHQQGVDISDLAKQNAALTFNLKVETPPDDIVNMRMDCHYPCTGQIDVTKLLKTLPKNEWQTVAIDLSCFEQEGAELSQINTPFLLGTSGNLSVAVSHISITMAPSAQKKMSCQQLAKSN